MVDMMGKSAPAFLVKTYMVVEDPATDAVISWNPDGTAFVVWHPPEFARDHLPTIFKHCNFSSFVRQLNTYGFRKVATNRWEFSNDLFRKDKKDQLCKIRRRKSMSSNKPKHNVQVSIVDDEDERSLSTSSSSELTILIDENTRLKQENNILNSELAAMKNKCNELVELVYGGDDSEKEEQCVQMDEDDDNGVLKLFGVRMKVGGEREIKKRKRVEARENARVLLFQSCK